MGTAWSLHLPRPAHAVLAVLASLLFLAETVRGETDYRDLREVAGRLGMKTRWVEKGEQLELYSQWTRLGFTRHRREMELNGLRLHLGFPVQESRGRLQLAEDDYRHLILPILTPQAIEGPVPGIRHIVLDAGHGGDDPGAENPALGLREKSLVLDFTRRLERQLEAAGFRVSQTRSEDRFIPLEERSRIANRLEADLFLSLHFNASVKSAVSGIETFVYTPPGQPSTSRAEVLELDRRIYPGNRNGPWSTLAGYYVQRSLLEATGATDRGLKRARFTVLEGLQMPGLLIEGGFVSHETEGRNIGSAAYRDTLAKAIVEGVLTYRKTLQRLPPAEP